MSEPRLEDSASEFERELLAAGTPYRVSADAKAKTLSALGLGVTAGAGAALGLGGAETLSTAVNPTVSLGSKLGSTAWSKLVGWTHLAGWTKGTVATAAVVGTLVAVPVGYSLLRGEELPAAPSIPPAASPRSGSGTAARAEPTEASVGAAGPRLGGAESPRSSTAEQDSTGEQVPSGEQRGSTGERVPPGEQGSIGKQSLTGSPRAQGEATGPSGVSRETQSRADEAPSAQSLVAGSSRDPRAGSNSKGEARSEAANAALRAEVRALDDARATLAAGNPAAALALLDAYDRGYPRGLLKLEAEVVRIDALARSGQTDTARRRADAFLRQHPKSVLASRVRRYSSP